MATDKEFLDKFGKLLIQEVRDPSIQKWEKYVSGQMKGERAKAISSLLTSFSDEQRRIIVSFAPYIVNNVLHNLLQMLEDEEEIDITVSIDGETSSTLRDISDGLGAEIYNDEGWIVRFSEYPEIDA
jgi:hypothetical protein